VRVGGARASSGIFDVFGAPLALGRGFTAAEDRAGAAPVAVISHRLWRERFEGQPSAIGRTLLLSGRPYTVVGVLAEGFAAPAMWPRMPDVWVPIGLDPNVARRNARMLRVVGRMRPGITVDAARAELDVLATALAKEHPDTNAGTGATAAGMLEQLTRDVRPSLFILATAVLALLLVACGNATGLLIGGALERRQEFATRLALGAGPARIVRQMLAENLVVGLAAAALGFALALLASDLLVGVATAAGVPRAADIRVGPLALGVATALSLACASGCALAAAAGAVRARDLQIARGAGFSTPARHRSRALLIAVQTALSLALLAGGGLLVRSFYALRATDPGFEASRVLTTRLSVPQARYPAGPVLAAFYDRAIERVRELPGVEAASVVDWLPVSGFGASVPFAVADGAPATSSMPAAELRVIGEDYFRTLGIPVLAGRGFDGRDVEGAPGAVVVNAALARAHFGDAPAVGRQLTLDRGAPLDVEIVGIVGDVRDLALQLPAGPAIYAPKTQQPWMRHETRDLVIRTAGDPSSVVPAVETALRGLEPEMPRAPVLRMGEVIGSALVRPRFYASAVALFALVAVVIAAFGIQGVVSSAVTERRRELGIRLALGASRSHVLGRAARQGVMPTLVGLAAGAPLALVAGRIVRQQLYGIAPTDWATLTLVALVMSLIAGAAAIVPAVRATRIDPVVTLRHDTAT
jgi:predicted permease